MRIFTGILLWSILFLSCGSDKVVVPNTEGVEVEFDILRMDQSIMKLDTNNIEDALNNLKIEYPNFMEIYLTNIMGFTDKTNPNSESSNMKGFIQDHNINLLYQATQLQYGEVDDIEEDLHQAFKFYKYYFPERSIPNVYMLISEFGIQRFVFSDENGDDALGIGLDLFLGADYPYQEFIPNNPAFSSYLIRRFNKAHLVKRAVGALVEDILGPNKGNNMLEKMLHNGKKIYILDKLLPYEPDSILMEYTEAQIEWCDNNQLEMWAFLLKEDLFYESDINKINKLVNPSPNSTGMPSSAPGRTGNYMGWKIVDAFMKKKPEMTLTDLLLFEDAQKILEISKFKPKR